MTASSRDHLIFPCFFLFCEDTCSIAVGDAVGGEARLVGILVGVQRECGGGQVWIAARKMTLKLQDGLVGGVDEEGSSFLDLWVRQRSKWRLNSVKWG